MNIEQPTSNSEQPMAEGRGGDLAFGGYEGGGQGLRGHYRSVNGVLMGLWMDTPSVQNSIVEGGRHV